MVARTLPPGELATRCDAAALQLDTDAGAALPDIVGQDRARAAVEFGIAMRHAGYHLVRDGSARLRQAQPGAPRHRRACGGRRQPSLGLGVRQQLRDTAPADRTAAGRRTRRATARRHARAGRRSCAAPSPRPSSRRNTQPSWSG